MARNSEGDWQAAVSSCPPRFEFLSITRRAYGAQWLAWCKREAISSFAAAREVVASYLAERGAAGQSVSTLRTVVAAIKAGHDANGLAFDSKAPVITKSLRGIANIATKLPRQSEPIRTTDVLQMAYLRRA